MVFEGPSIFCVVFVFGITKLFSHFIHQEYFQKNVNSH
jgi:hypothetical protein